jgi:hypothetical protein
MSSTPSSGDFRDQNVATGSAGFLPDDAIDLRDLFARLVRGLPQIAGLALIGLAIAAIGSWVFSRYQDTPTTTRVIFSFPGFEKGEYPDKSKFQSDDLRAPTIISEALKRQGLEASTDFQSKIRSALNVEGIIPPNIVKDRDRQRASGQTPPPYISDEYSISLSLPRNFAMGVPKRESLLREIVSVYRENFQRTFADIPLAFGTAFSTLRNADFPEYELVLGQEIQNITGYLDQQVEQARSFRSITTNLSFKDLQEQTELFSQIQLNETLGHIHENGLSKNRRTAMTKMDYYLRQMDDRERRAVEEEKLVRDLLSQAQTREQNYVLGIKSQTSQPRNDTPILDSGLINSLLANDAYNFLVRRALEAGLAVKKVQAEKIRLSELRDNLKSFMRSDLADQSAIMATTQKSLADMEVAYQQLIAKIRQTHADFSRQQFGNALRLSDQVRTPGIGRPLAIAAAVGCFLGFAIGAGFSLLGVYIGKRIAA